MMKTEFTSNFAAVEENVNFAKQEEKILQYWDSIDAFKKQLEITKDFPKYTFYDGPPFATGLPHYGHITAGTLKDVVTRYWTQNGRYCERRFGWDCHGLPIECIINEEEKIKSKKDLMTYGIANYNKKCREGVMKYAREWEEYTRRFGRWIDFKNDYKTMDKDFMESVWWVFKQIFDKGLVYRKCKVMPYSWACNTVLSNFEAGQAYKDVADPSIYVHFPLVDKPNVSFIAWTTTPWTLPSNLGLTVNPKFKYLQVRDKEKNHDYILLAELVDKTMKAIHVKDYETVGSFLGSELLGISYVPLFDDFYEKYKANGCYKVLNDEFVTNEDGTGIVHTAPAFGEDDFRVSINHGIIDQDSPLCPIDDDGNFNSEFKLVAGLNFKVSDNVIVEDLKKRGRLLAKGTLNHKYAMCYRTGQPLMNKAIPSWFINVEKVKDDLIANNLKAEWVPKYVQEKRFHNWLQNAKDWCISRSRAWGNPIPIWVSDDMEEVVCLSSLKELQELSGCGEITDMHREFIDNITIPSKKGKGVLKRIPEVFDCWFESGSMPYAQLSYPHKLSHEEFEKRFPADFIAEGLDQTRGWFYTLNVIATIVFNQNPYKNLIVNGLVLAEDGKKMSKKDKNYPDPFEMCNKHGADSIRLYLMNSQLVKGQSLKFKEVGLSGIVKDIFLPLFNSYKFIVQNIHRFEMTNNTTFKYDPTIITESYDKLNLTDKWILAYSQRLIKYVRTEMENYRLYTVVAELLNFLEKLTNWYIRLNRLRIKGDYGKEDALFSLNILFNVTLDLIILLSPFIPFLTEAIYQNLKNGIENPAASIHFLQIPVPNERLINIEIENTIKDMICVIEQGRYLRENKKIVMKKPVAKIQIINSSQKFLDNIKLMENYVIEELNTNEIEYLLNESEFVKVSANPNFEFLYQKAKEIKENAEEGKEDDPEVKEEEAKAKAAANAIAALIKKLDEKALTTIILEGKHETGIPEIPVITKEQILIKKEFHKKFASDKEYHNHANSENAIRISTLVNDHIMNTFYCRDLVNKIQKQRKETGIKITDTIVIGINLVGESPKLKLMLSSTLKDQISKVVKVQVVFDQTTLESYNIHNETEHEVAEEKIKVIIFKKD